MTLKETIKRYKKHSECIQQTLITKEEAMNVYELLKELKKWRDFGNSIGRVLGKHFTKEELFKMMEVDTDGLEENS